MPLCEVWNLWIALAITQKFADVTFRFWQSSALKTSPRPLDIEGGFRLFNTAATASSKFSSPPSELFVRAPLCTSFLNSCFSE